MSGLYSVLVDWLSILALSVLNFSVVLSYNSFPTDYFALGVCSFALLCFSMAQSPTRLIGLAYPLFFGFITLYLTTQVADSDTSVFTTYRNYAIISVMGVPGSIIACLVVDWTRKDKSAFAMGGRKITLAFSTALTGIFLFLFTTSKTEIAVLGFSCASGLTEWVLSCLFTGSSDLSSRNAASFLLFCLIITSSEYVDVILDVWWYVSILSTELSIQELT